MKEYPRQMKIFRGYPYSGPWQGLAESCLGQRRPFADGNRVRHCAARVETMLAGLPSPTRIPTRCGKDGLDGSVSGWPIAGLKHTVGHTLTVVLGLPWRLRPQRRVPHGATRSLLWKAAPCSLQAGSVFLALLIVLLQCRRQCWQQLSKLLNLCLGSQNVLACPRRPGVKHPGSPGVAARQTANL